MNYKFKVGDLIGNIHYWGIVARVLPEGYVVVWMQWPEQGRHGKTWLESDVSKL